MRLIALGLAIFFGSAAPILAQSTPQKHVSGDVALTYQWVHSNAQPGDCGCFSLNGAGLSGSLTLRPRWSVVLETDFATNANAGAAGSSLTLASLYLGARYAIPRPWKQKAHSLQPFGQILLGGMHAGGGTAGDGDGDLGFSLRAGGGLDMPLAGRFALRLIQIDYNSTNFSNTTNDHQNNLLIATGLAYHW